MGDRNVELESSSHLGAGRLEDCTDQNCPTTMDDWEEMVYEDLMGSHWTDEGIIKHEMSHRLFETMDDNELQPAMNCLRTIYPRQAIINLAFPEERQEDETPIDLTSSISFLYFLQVS